MSQRTISLTLTLAGMNALISAQQRSMDVQFSAIALGSGTAPLTSSAVALTSEQERSSIFSASQPAPGQLRINSLFDTDPPAPYSATELTLIGDGVVFGVWSTSDPAQALVVRTPGVPYTASITVGYGQLPLQNISVVIQPLDVAAQAAADDAVTTAINTLLQQTDPFDQYVSGVVDQAGKPAAWRAQAIANLGLTGVAFTSQLGTFVPTGAGLPFFGGAVPAGFLLANGAAVSRATYAALFGQIGTTYGAGDGASTFNLPDSRGVSLRGLDNGRGLDSGRALGSYQADAYAYHNHSISDPLHSHGVNDPSHGHGVADYQHAHSFTVIAQNVDSNGSGALTGGTLDTGNDGVFTGTTNESGSNIGIYASGTNIGIYGSATGISIQGAGASETRGKNLAVNYIIKY